MRRLIYTLIILCLLFALAATFAFPRHSFSVASKKIAQVIIPQKKFYLVFAGDIMLDRDVEKSIYQNGAGDWRYPFFYIADLTASADIAFANLEGALSDKGTNQGSIYSFRMDPRALEGLKYAGFDVLALANNHSLDWGHGALLDTISRLNKAGIKTVGAGQNAESANAPAIFTLKDGTKIAYLAYTNLYPKSLEATASRAGISHFSQDAAIEAIHKIKKDNLADLVIINFHWGYEYETAPRDWQKDLAHKLIDAGADLIVGHHPHVVQPVEKYVSSDNPKTPSVILSGAKDPGIVQRDSSPSAQNDKHVGYIAYSLGNFVFDQFFSQETMRGLVLQAEVQNGQITKVTQIPVQLTPQYQPYIAH